MALSDVLKRLEKIERERSIRERQLLDSIKSRLPEIASFSKKSAENGKRKTIFTASTIRVSKFTASNPTRLESLTFFAPSHRADL